MRSSLALVLVFLSMIEFPVAAHANPKPDKPKSVAQGTWGGEHVEMTVDANGAAFEFDCANASVTEPLALDKNGRFAAKGAYRRESGAARADGGGAATPADFTGTVDGKKMKLQMKIEGIPEPQVFELELDGKAQLTKCM